MTKAGVERSVTLIDDDNFWSRYCVVNLQEQELNPRLLEPRLELLEGDKIAGELFIIPVPSFSSERLDLVRKVSTSGGTSLVLAGRDFNDLSWALTLTMRSAYCFRKSADFSELNGAIRLLRPAWYPQKST